MLLKHLLSDERFFYTTYVKQKVRENLLWTWFTVEFCWILSAFVRKKHHMVQRPPKIIYEKYNFYTFYSHETLSNSLKVWKLQNRRKNLTEMFSQFNQLWGQTFWTFKIFIFSLFLFLNYLLLHHFLQPASCTG